MSAWAVFLAEQQHETERLIHHDTLEVSAPADGAPAAGEQVLVLAGEPAQVVALGRVRDTGRPGRPLEVRYTRQFFDEPLPADGLPALDPVAAGPAAALLAPVADEVVAAVVSRLGPDPDRQNWLVSVHLPIEAASRAEAVRIFWSYVQELGPRELPAFVSPSHDELAMQAFVLGAEANQDPEEDDEEQ
ncbi:hypothetical protein ACK8GG_03080 [Micromonosporaceae bacterium DT55]|uniref:hypothetical protein n=1 Tax=Melissospora conviva TaxID=3388432 RepID=UPI003C15A186